MAAFPYLQKPEAVGGEDELPWLQCVCNPIVQNGWELLLGDVFPKVSLVKQAGV